MSEKINVQLSPGKRFPLRIYLMLCRKCPSVTEKMRALRKVFLGLEAASSQNEIRLPESSQKRIQQILHEQ